MWSPSRDSAGSTAPRLSPVWSPSGPLLRGAQGLVTLLDTLNDSDRSVTTSGSHVRVSDPTQGTPPRVPKTPGGDTGREALGHRHGRRAGMPPRVKRPQVWPERTGRPGQRHTWGPPRAAPRPGTRRATRSAGFATCPAPSADEKMCVKSSLPAPLCIRRNGRVERPSEPPGPLAEEARRGDPPRAAAPPLSTRLRHVLNLTANAIHTIETKVAHLLTRQPRLADSNDYSHRSGRKIIQRNRFR